jgi:hypothetical protein
VAGYCGYSNKVSVLVKGGEFPEKLLECQFLKKDASSL